MGDSYSRRQWVTLVVFSIAQFCNAVCVSLQAPFYPAEAEKKGATATEYGLVFGVFELIVFIISPIYGKYLDRIGPRLMNNAGITTVAVMCICFGFLDRIDDPKLFIAMSFIIRIVEALGNAAFITSAFTLIAAEFQTNVGAAFAAMETFFGLGLIVGPTVGGALYELGGYTLPFVVMGALLFVAAILVCILLPKRDERPVDHDTEKGTKGSMLTMLKIPSIAIFAFTIMAASISIGFLQATLEPHLRPLELTPVIMGVMFVLNGGAYAVLAPFWGWLCDHIFSPRLVTLVGSAIVSLSFILIGPVPFIPLQMTLPLVIAALVLHGVGFGAELVATFTGIQQDAISNGFTEGLSTYGLVSGLWTSVFALGCFIGPSLGGLILDSIGFQWGTVFVVVLHILVLLFTGSYMIHVYRADNFTIVYSHIHGSLAIYGDEKQSLLLSTKKKDRDSFSSVTSRDSTYGSAGNSDEYHRKGSKGPLCTY
ncbi:unnamed protein product, partial [Meganyctiphanes norvegica]|uniref:Major facilitator superfamily (MFS) profile domain-containing protein n=1 Tax=Meganyctiphanes norvegica TaxID=48144 RepID=A0AAV2R1H4_MEGNR